MNDCRRIISYFLTIIVCLVSFSGCSIMEPHKKIKFEAIFLECYEDIETVVDFMIISEYETIIINAESRTGLYSKDGYHYESEELVLDTKMETAVNRLLKVGFKQIVKSGNTIQLGQAHWLFSIDHGVACAINGQDLPDIDYVTELIPTEKEGWYYYVADFNQWRLEQKNK